MDGRRKVEPLAAQLGDGEHAVIIRGGLIYSDIVVVQGALAPSGAR